jgi:hypothetical protein
LEIPLKLFTSSILRYSGLSDDEDEDLSGDVRKWTLKVTKHDVTVLEYGRASCPCSAGFTSLLLEFTQFFLYTSVYQHKAMTTKDQFNWKFHDPQSSTKYGSIFRASSAIP